MSVTYNVYRSSTPMNVGSMPSPIVTNLTNKSYSDSTVTSGITYYYRIGAIKYGVERISPEITVIAT